MKFGVCFLGLLLVAATLQDNPSSQCISNLKQGLTLVRQLAIDIRAGNKQKAQQEIISAGSILVKTFDECIDTSPREIVEYILDRYLSKQMRICLGNMLATLLAAKIEYDRLKAEEYTKFFALLPALGNRAYNAVVTCNGLFFR